MPEVEREEILAQRQEELQRIQDKRNLDQMLRDRTGGGDDSVSKAAKSMYSAHYIPALFTDLCRATFTTGSHEGEVAKTRRAQGQAES